MYNSAPYISERMHRAKWTPKSDNLTFEVGSLYRTAKTVKLLKGVTWPQTNCLVVTKEQTLLCVSQGNRGCNQHYKEGFAVFLVDNTEVYVPDMPNYCNQFIRLDVP